MAKNIRVDGVVHSFPDDATDQDITRTLNGASSPLAPGNGAPPLPKAPYQTLKMEENPLAPSGDSLIAKGQETYAKEKTHGMPGSFEGHPENIGEYAPQTIGEIAGGAKDIVKGDVSKGLHRTISGAMNIPAPMLPIITAGAPIPTIVSAALGMGGQKAAKAGASALGATEDQSNLAGDFGAIVGGYGGAKLGSAGVKAAPGLAKKVVEPMVYEGVNEAAGDARFGTDPARGLVDEGMVGSKKGMAENKIPQRLGELKSRADNILKNHPNSRTQINAEPIIDEAINSAQAAAQRQGAQGTVTRLEALRTALKKQHGPLQGTPYEVNELKTRIQDTANELGGYANMEPGEASAAQAAKDVASGIRRAVDARVPEAAELNGRMSDLIDAKAGLNRKVNLAKGEDIFGGRPGTSDGVLGRLGQRTLGSAPVRTTIARVLNAGNVKAVPPPQNYVPPQIAGLLKAAPIELGSEMEPIGQPSEPSPTLPYRPSLQNPPAFVAPGQIRSAGPPQELLFPNESPTDFPAGTFNKQGNLFQIPIEVQRALGIGNPLDRPNGGSGGLPLNPSPEVMAKRPSAVPSPDYEYRPEGVKQDVGDAARSEKPPIPRGDRRARTRSSDELVTQDAWKQARKELGDDATSEAIEAKVKEIKSGRR